MGEGKMLHAQQAPQVDADILINWDISTQGGHRKYFILKADGSLTVQPKGAREARTVQIGNVDTFLEQDVGSSLLDGFLQVKENYFKVPSQMSCGKASLFHSMERTNKLVWNLE